MIHYVEGVPLYGAGMAGSVVSLIMGYLSSLMCVLAAILPDQGPTDRVMLRIGAISGLVLSLGGFITALGTQVVAIMKMRQDRLRLQEQAQESSIRIDSLASEVVELRATIANLAGSSRT